MLEQLFGSKTRTKLMKLFLLNPEQIYFIRELTRVIDTQINSVRRELDNLEHCGLIRVVPASDPKVLKLETDADEEFDKKKPAEKKGTKRKETQPKKYYTVNKEFVLHKELYLLLLRSPLLFQKKFIGELKNLESVDFAMITGFFLQTEGAPVDLLVVGDISKQKIVKLISFYEREFEREINFSTMTTEEFLYRKSLTDRFLFKILDSKKIVVIDHLGISQT
ncbi:MAG: hypothetical protein AAB416_03205 [Patescibacteria group bacterium]